MACDQGLLDLADREEMAVLRLYRWDPFCISFGRHEPARLLYNRVRIESLGLEAVRRPTGGRAVWHARHLTYAVAAPRQRFGTFQQAYREIHQMLATAVASLGARPSLAPTPDTPTGIHEGACFSHAAGGEVMVLGKKVVGSAQVRQGSAFLQHGVLLLDDAQEALAEVSVATARPLDDAALSFLLGRQVSFQEAATAVSQAAASWPGEWITTPDHAPFREAARRHHARFHSEQWTWLR